MRNSIPNFFSFDGPNGAGKTTLVREVAAALRLLNHDVFLTKEPTSSPLGELIRRGEETYRGIALAHLVTADRAWHLDQEILPAIKNKNIVITDRYIGSSLALQGLDGIDLETIWQMNQNFALPSANIFIMADSSNLKIRLNTRSLLTRFEKAYTREQEIGAYNKAIEFLKERNVSTEVFYNDGTIAKGLSHLVQLIVTNIR